MEYRIVGGNSGLLPALRICGNSPAVFPQTMVLLIMGWEITSLLSPPPSAAELQLIVQLVIAGALSRISMPPPKPAELSCTRQLTIGGSLELLT